MRDVSSVGVRVSDRATRGVLRRRKSERCEIRPAIRPQRCGCPQRWHWRFPWALHFSRPRGGAARYAQTLIQTQIYAGTVLTNAAAVIAPARGEVAHALWPQLVALLLAIGLAVLALQPKTIPAWAPTVRFAGNLWHPFHVLQSGRVTDYVAWLALGVAAWSAVLLIQL